MSSNVYNSNVYSRVHWVGRAGRKASWVQAHNSMFGQIISLPVMERDLLTYMVGWS